MNRPDEVSFKKGFKDKPVKKHSASSSASIKDIRSATTSVSSLLFPTSSQAIKIFGLDCVRTEILLDTLNSCSQNCIRAFENSSDF